MFWAVKGNDLAAISTGISLPWWLANQQVHTGETRTLRSLPVWRSSQLAKGVSRAREAFFFHSSLPGAQIPSQCLLFFFILPSYLGILALVILVILCQFSVGYLWELFHTQTHADVFLMCLWSRWAPCPTPPSWSLLPHFSYNSRSDIFVFLQIQLTQIL